MKEYTLALDIGTTSVGWSIVDESYQIPKFDNKYLWGVRLFDSAKTAEFRRTKRGARRRYLRRRRRLELLQYLFQDEIGKIDSNFFDVTVKEDEWLKNKPVLKEGNSFHNFENKSLAEVLKNIGMNTREYKNIYFLQKEIIEKKEKVDLRLLYLAIYSNVKYRGHFLNNFNFMEYKPTLNIENDLLSYLEIDELSGLSKVIEILKSNYNITAKKSELKKHTNDKMILERLNLLIGSKVSLAGMFIDSKHDKKIKVCLKDDSPLETLEIDDLEFDVLEKGYNIYLDLLIGNVLLGEDNICKAYVNAYNRFKEDLKDFKYIVKKYKKSEYKKLFKKNGTLDNYMYGKNNSVNDCNLTKDKAYNEIVNIINSIKAEGDSTLDNLKLKVENRNLFLKQRSSINASTPHQLKARDVYDMLSSQSEYYEFIDDDFINDVLKLITYRIPYYVGPLLKKREESDFGWLTRNEGAKITPWNIDEIIDKDMTAREFIERMINRCSELYNVDVSKIDNKVLPKESLTYQLFMVYNELNGIKIKEDGRKPRLLTLEERDRIIERGFKKKKQVKLKDAVNCLGLNSEVEIVGTQDEDSFASSLSTYNFFSAIVDDPMKYIDEIDEVVKVLNVFNDKEIIDRQLRKIEVFNDDIETLKRLQVTGWGRLSKHLLKNIEDDGNSILKYLIDGSSKEVITFRKLVTSDDYAFKKQIQVLNNSSNLLIKNFEDHFTDVEKLAGSPALKRGVWETLKVVNELIDTHKINVKTIAIEFAGGDEDKKRSVSFEKKIREIGKYSKEHDALLKEIEKEKSIEYGDTRVRLYLLQQGKCMYSGIGLEIDKLDQYEVDHIRPRSLTKDDSINNLALVLREYNQRKNDGETVLEFIPSNKRSEVIAFWSTLHKVGAISQVKYARLMKEKNSEQELERFLQRTLVETRQIGKHVKELLNNYYGNDIKIYNVSSDFTGKFRKELGIHKVRGLSVKHHCQDAYMLAIVTAHTLSTFGEDFFELGKGNTKYWYVNKKDLFTTKNKANILIQNLLKSKIRINNAEVNNPREYFKDELNKEFLLTHKVSYSTNERLWEETNYSPLRKKDKHFAITKNDKISRSEYTKAYLLLVEYDKYEKKTKKYARERKLISVDKIVDVYKEHKTYIDVAKYYLEDKRNISIIKRVDIGSIIENDNRFIIKNESEKANFNEFNISESVYKAFYEIINNKNIELLSVKDYEEYFDIIVKYVENNFKDIYGNNVTLIKEKFNDKILEKNKNDASEKFESILRTASKDNSIVDSLKIDFILDESQMKLIRNEPGATIEEIIHDLATVCSSGDIKAKKVAIELLSGKYKSFLDEAYKHSVKTAVNELVNAISIGSGRSDTFGIGRMEKAIDINEFRLVYQSSTGLLEKKTELLSEIKRDKKLRKV